MALNVHVTECNVGPSSAPDMVGAHWVDTVAKLHYLSVGTSSVNDWILIPAIGAYLVTVPASTTQVIHTIPLADFCNLHYQICYSNASEDKYGSALALVGKVTSTTISDSVSSVLGYGFNKELNFNVNGSDCEVEVVNNEIYDLTFKFKVEIV